MPRFPLTTGAFWDNLWCVVQFALPGVGVADLVIERRKPHACRPPLRRGDGHGSRHHLPSSRQLSLLDWRPRLPALVVKPQAPTNYRQCLAMGLGTSRPCPWYRCRHHLGIDVNAHGEVWILIPPDELEGRETCALAAIGADEDGEGGRSRSPNETAEVTGLSLGTVEWVQRQGLAALRAALGSIRDKARGVTVDIDGMRDCRS